MPVSSEVSIAGPYYPNGVTVDFAFEFKAASAGEVVATDGDGNAISATLYSVTLDDDEGGTLSFGSAPAAADYPVIYVVSDPALTQPADFDNAGPSFNPAALTRAIDRAAVRDLKQQRDIDRGLKVPFGETPPLVDSLTGADGMGLGVVNGKIAPIANDVAGAEDAAGRASASAAQAANIRAAVAADKVATAADRAAAEQAVDDAAVARDQAIVAGMAQDIYPLAARDDVPRGASGTGAITGGSGGTDGTFALAFTGGNFNVNPMGTFTVSGGAVTAISITGAGLYIGDSPTAPTLDFSASTGLTSAAAALTVDFLVQAGAYYYAPSTDDGYVSQFQNVAGTATLIEEHFDPLSVGAAAAYADAAETAALAITTVNAWPDTFFREIELTNPTLGGEYFGNLANWDSIAPRADSPFLGRSLKHASSVSGGASVYIYLDALGAEVGDDVSFLVSWTGDGVGVNGYIRWLTAAGAAIGSLTNFVTRISAGLTTEYHDTVTSTVPATAHHVQLLFQPSGTPGDFYIDAISAIKGSSIATFHAYPQATPAAAIPRMARLEETAEIVPKLGTAVDSVSWTAMAIRDAVTGVLYSTGTSTFAGYGENRTPDAPIDVNALRIPGNLRAAVPPIKWARMVGEIRDGGTTGTILSSGSVAVDPEVGYLGEIIIPMTPVTLSTKYFVSFYAVDALGNRANVGRTIGTSATRHAESYFVTTTSGTWATYTGNPPMGIELLDLTGTAVATKYRPDPLSDPKLIVLAPKTFGVVGLETNIYFDNLVAANASRYSWDVTVTGGTAANYVQLAECLRITPTVAQTATITIIAKDALTGVEVARATTAFEAVAADAASAEAPVQLYIGDSLTVGYIDSGNANTGAFTQTILDNAAAEAGTPFAPVLIGTKTNGTAGNNHEGIAGKTVQFFFSDPTSPFVFSGAFDFSAYMAAHSYAAVDEVVIRLGTNTASGATSDGNAEALAAIDVGMIEQMITSIHAFDADTVVTVQPPWPVAASQDAFGANYAAALSRDLMKRNVIAHKRVLQERFRDRESEGIRYADCGLGIDPANNMPEAAAAPVNARNADTIVRQSNGLHPAIGGYQQGGDLEYARLKVMSA